MGREAVVRTQKRVTEAAADMPGIGDASRFPDADGDKAGHIVMAEEVDGRSVFTGRGGRNPACAGRTAGFGIDGPEGVARQMCREALFAEGRLIREGAQRRARPHPRIGRHFPTVRQTIS